VKEPAQALRDRSSAGPDLEHARVGWLDETADQVHVHAVRETITQSAFDIFVVLQPEMVRHPDALGRHVP
jgi:hypothetical protein